MKWKKSNSGRSLEEILKNCEEMRGLLLAGKYGNIQLEHLEALKEVIEGFLPEEDYYRDLSNQLNTYFITQSEKLEKDQEEWKTKTIGNSLFNRPNHTDNDEKCS